MPQSSLSWDLPNPFTWRISCGIEHEDRLAHVNNVQYLHWLEETGWQHITQLGAPWDEWKKSGVGMATRESHIEYLAAARAGDLLYIGTWLTGGDRLRMTRHFQIIRVRDNITLLRADIHYVCIDLVSGKPKRKPPFMEQAHQAGMQAAGFTI
ncbi:thioesterase family protein [Parendozoicomonas sp. Alg238-R29]|uniref:acyl-CoA thioesterase n=1 Tax=Parendozoicomonas sp. Alg238-R29 TaxID=2993446 RepID=UPI00248E23C3|nr:thioesterase family protein [Parendozoicomonas sp. Alg238-R29]